MARKRQDTPQRTPKRVKPSLVASFLAWSDERLSLLFTAKQIVFRTEGRVSCLDLTPRLQGAVAGVALVIGGWMAFTSGNMLWH